MKISDLVNFLNALYKTLPLLSLLPPSLSPFHSSFLSSLISRHCSSLCPGLAAENLQLFGVAVRLGVEVAEDGAGGASPGFCP